MENYLTNTYAAWGQSRGYLSRVSGTALIPASTESFSPACENSAYKTSLKVCGIFELSRYQQD